MIIRQSKTSSIKNDKKHTVLYIKLAHKEATSVISETAEIEQAVTRDLQLVKQEQKLWKDISYQQNRMAPLGTRAAT